MNMFRSFTKPVFTGRKLIWTSRNVNNVSDTYDLLCGYQQAQRWLLSPHAVSAGTFHTVHLPHSNDREKRSRQAMGEVWYRPWNGG